MTKYDLPYFWEKLYYEDVELWKGLYRNEPLTEDSIIVYIYALNANTFQYENSWVVYPNTHAFIGFLKYIYLPTVFIGFLKNKSEYDRYYSDDLARVINQYEELAFNEHTPFLKNLFSSLDRLWNLEDFECVNEMKTIGKELYNFRPEEHVHFYFEIFQSPSEMAQSIVSKYESEPSVGLAELENHLGMTKEHWLAIAKNVYENIFIEKQFISILSKQLSHSL